MSKLEDFCINITDGEHGTVKDVQASEFFLLSNKNIKNSKIYIDSSDRTISKADYEKINKRTKLEHEDVVIATVGTIGKTAVLDNPSNYVFQRSVGIIKTNKKILNPYYLKYQIDAPYFQNRLQLLSKGGVQKCIFINDIKKLDVNIPPIKEQEEIVSILKNIDSKIENNNAIISELESMAKDIYDYWFVQFNFPNENGKPYKSSGGKMVWNEELKRKIPEGWKVSSVGKEVKVLLGGTPKTSDLSLWNGDIPWLSSGELIQSPVIKSEKTITKKGKDLSSTEFAKAGAVVMSITRYIRPAILGIDACFNQSVVALLPSNTLWAEFLYPFLLSQIDTYLDLRTGAQQPHINKEIVESTKLLVPSVSILKKYYALVNPVYELQFNCAKQVQELTSLRDYLLPLLMNGQVKIGDVSD